MPTARDAAPSAPPFARRAVAGTLGTPAGMAATTSGRPAPEPAAGPALRAALEAAVGLLREEDLPGAEAALQAVLARHPGQPDALHFLGIARHAQGRHEEALALIRRAIAGLPGEPGPWNNLGNVLLETQRLDEAAAAYRASIAVAPQAPSAADACNNLGVLHRKRGEWALAEQACREALAHRPGFVEAWYNLSQVLLGQGRVHEGLQANSRAILLAPRHLHGRDQVLRALLLLGEREQAAALYREWLAEDPDNPVVRHQYAACLGEAAPERASDACMRQLFDAFSRSFDVKLGALGYRAPALVAAALERAVGAPAAALDIADAGCGTGLVGAQVRPWARALWGADLSAGMLRQAHARRLYDRLHEAELTHWLATQPAAFDAVLSADTLCYFGPLDAPLAAAATALRPGGWLVFTVEALDAPSEARTADADADAAPAPAVPPHRLQPHGRYAHARAHVAQALAGAGLGDPVIEPVTLRQEAGRPVRGWLVRARRPAPGAGRP